MIPAIILTAGLGTRLQPLTSVRTKAAMPVGGEPMAARILRWLAQAGVEDAICNLHHLPHTLTRLIGDGLDIGIQVRYSWESRILGSAGGPRRAAQLLTSRQFFLVNGDMLTDVNLNALRDAHEHADALVTMAVVPNTEPHRYGGARLDAERRVTGFVPRGQAEPSYHFIGVQVADADAFSHIPSDTPWESTQALYPTLIAGRLGSVRGFVCGATWHDIGTPVDYLNTVRRFQQPTGVSQGASTRIDSSADVSDSVLWDDVDVGADVRLRGCVVTDGVRLPPGTEWHDAIIRRNAGTRLTGESLCGDLLVTPLRDRS